MNTFRRVLLAWGMLAVVAFVGVGVFDLSVATRQNASYKQQMKTQEELRNDPNRKWTEKEHERLVDSLSAEFKKTNPMPDRTPNKDELNRWRYLRREYLEQHGVRWDLTPLTSEPRTPQFSQPFRQHRLWYLITGAAALFLFVTGWCIGAPISRHHS